MASANYPGVRREIYFQNISPRSLAVPMQEATASHLQSGAGTSAPRHSQANTPGSAPGSRPANPDPGAPCPGSSAPVAPRPLAPAPGSFPAPPPLSPTSPPRSLLDAPSRRAGPPLGRAPAPSSPQDRSRSAVRPGRAPPACTARGTELGSERARARAPPPLGPELPSAAGPGAR